jgi:hypothetical protein
VCVGSAISHISCSIVTFDSDDCHVDCGPHVLLFVWAEINKIFPYIPVVCTSSRN